MISQDLGHSWPQLQHLPVVVLVSLKLAALSLSHLHVLGMGVPLPLLKDEDLVDDVTGKLNAEKTRIRAYGGSNKQNHTSVNSLASAETGGIGTKTEENKSPNVLLKLNNSDDKSNNLKNHKDHLLDNLVIVHVSHNYIHKKLIDEV